MIDIHCHILPAVDDGAASLEESLAMARLAVADGITAVLATPHTLNGISRNTVPHILSSVSHLQGALVAEGVPLKIFPGSEVHLVKDMCLKIRSGEICTLNNNGKYVLIELPYQSVPDGIKQEIFDLKLDGITPIIAHPERNAAIQNNPRILRELVYMGALSQVTAMSIVGDFGPETRESAKGLLECRLVHLIASDAHSPGSRPPQLRNALEEAASILGNIPEAEAMVTQRPAAVISGDSVDCSSPLEPRQKHSRCSRPGTLERLWKACFGAR
jgi:protein-tyrosine phosphatase